MQLSDTIERCPVRGEIGRKPIGEPARPAIVSIIVSDPSRVRDQEYVPVLFRLEQDPDHTVRMAGNVDGDEAAVSEQVVTDFERRELLGKLYPCFLLDIFGPCLQVLRNKLRQKALQ